MKFPLVHIIFFSIALLALQASISDAADFVVGLSDISVSPSTIYAGNAVTIKTTYSVSSSISAPVRLQLLFDGNVVDSSYQYRSTGNYDATFTYTASGSDVGSHTIGVRARIYDGDVLKDEDITTKDIQVNALGGSHNIEITSITSKKTADNAETFPITVEIKNTGNSEEDNIVLSAKINGIVYFSSPFAILPGTSTTQTINVQAPLQSGNYEITLNAYNAYASDTGKTGIDVQGTFISLTLKKTAANLGEWVEIYGYATRGNYASETAVSLYIDGVSSNVIPTRENGYYYTKLKFDTPGSHKIQVMAGGLTTSQTIYISAPQTQPAAAPLQPGAQEITIPQGNYTAIIIVTGESQYVVYPQAMSKANNVSAKADKYNNFSFVNIDVSTKELDVMQNAGNLLKITMTNHLGRNEIFSVSTDFDQKWTYAPEADVITDGGKRVFQIYFNPDREGTFAGNVFVKQNGNVIKTIPVSLFVSPRQTEMKEAFPFGFALSTAKIAVLAMILAAAVLTLHFGLQKPKALEPKTFAPSGDVSEILKTMSSLSEIRRSPTEQNIFYAPRNKIII
ncbi:Uncharacterised protein [uncultured archaeon]|nr:Uncharacterised protein [uncultured archaeon]